LFRSAGLDLNFAGGVFSLNNTRTSNPAAIPGWSFSRTDTNGTATALDLAGNVIQFPSRTNLLLRSQELDTGAVWAASRATITANATTAPDGSVTADKLVENSSTNTHRVYQAVSKAGSSIQYTASMFFKAAERTFAHLRMTDSIEDDRAGVGINLSTGEVGTPYVGGGSPFTSVSASSQALADGWYRLTLTATTDTDTTVQVWAFTADGLTSASCSTNGNGVNGVFVWGAQLETGSTATDYIPTTTAAVTVVLPRITNRGILVEEARTNSVTNSSMIGAVVGSPGTFPTTWTGANWTVAGTGTENGLPYIDARYVGTPSGTQFLNFGANPAASAGQAWTTSVYTRLVAGSLTNVTALQLTAASTGGTPASANQTVSTATLEPAVRSTVTVTAGTGATGATSYIRMTGSGAVDFTIRLYAPKLELGAFATSPIITTGAAGTRGADVVNVGSAVLSPEGTILASYVVPAAAVGTTNRAYVWTTQESGNNRFALRAGDPPGSAGDGTRPLFIVGDGSALSSMAGTSLNSDTIAKTAASYSTLSAMAGVAFNGADQTAVRQLYAAATSQTFHLAQSNSAGAFLNSYLVRLQIIPRFLSAAERIALTAP
jgi:hypothetical protein